MELSVTGGARVTLQMFCRPAFQVVPHAAGPSQEPLLNTTAWLLVLHTMNVLFTLQNPFLQ